MKMHRFKVQEILTRYVTVEAPDGVSTADLHEFVQDKYNEGREIVLDWSDLYESDVTVEGTVDPEDCSEPDFKVDENLNAIKE